MQHRAKFFSDTNLDGFVQSIAKSGVEYVADSSTREVELEFIPDAIVDQINRWDGELLK